MINNSTHLKKKNNKIKTTLFKSLNNRKIMTNKNQVLSWDWNNDAAGLNRVNWLFQLCSTKHIHMIVIFFKTQSVLAYFFNCYVYYMPQGVGPCLGETQEWHYIIQLIGPQPIPFVYIFENCFQYLEFYN